jgi:hypothetical protein
MTDEDTMERMRELAAAVADATSDAPTEAAEATETEAIEDEAEEVRPPTEEELAASKAMAEAIARAHGADVAATSEPADYGPPMEEAARMMLGGIALIIDTMASLSPKQRARVPTEVLRLEENLKMAHEEYHHTGSGSKTAEEEMPEELSEFFSEAEAEAVATRAAAMAAPTPVSHPSYDEDDDDDDEVGEEGSGAAVGKKKSTFFDDADALGDSF